MKTIILASKNPVKVEATRDAFTRMFPEESFTLHQAAVPSGVADQPMSHQETYQGAFNRASGAQKQIPQADFWVGIEGGVEAWGDELAAFAWMVVLSATCSANSCTGTFFLPPEVARLVRQGTEMGEADDIVFNRTNSKQGEGACGILTHNVINRKELYEHALILALIPHRNPALYEAKSEG